MFKMTTSVVDGKRIVEYLDIVAGEVILSANIIKDVFSAIRDFVGVALLLNKKWLKPGELSLAKWKTKLNC